MQSLAVNSWHVASFLAPLRKWVNFNQLFYEHIACFIVIIVELEGSMITLCRCGLYFYFVCLSELACDKVAYLVYLQK